MDREVPIALQALRRAGVKSVARFSVLKGRENYLCWRALRLQVPEEDAQAEDWLAWTRLALFALIDGEGDLDRNVTRSGIHVVTEKYEDFYMSNPAAGYFNVRERFAVRISNNGEFIHANPETIGVQGSSNVTNGCINLSLENAQRYFETAVYGDPVEVTGTRIDLSEADGDIFDWIFDWDTWTGMSAIQGDPDQVDAPATPSGAPTSAAPRG